ncbi:hypothetical protein ACFXGO_29320 [Streptomyces roseus]|uniref:hypothetical protein n=1 Tax=Streptomyces roseus TaxID=66430 RepID=UPI00368927A9
MAQGGVHEVGGYAQQSLPREEPVERPLEVEPQQLLGAQDGEAVSYGEVRVAPGEESATGVRDVEEPQEQQFGPPPGGRLPISRTG